MQKHGPLEPGTAVVFKGEAETVTEWKKAFYE